MSMTRRLPILLLLGCLTLAHGAVAPPEGPEEEVWDLQCLGGVRPADPAAPTSMLALELRRRGTTWGRVIGHTGQYSLMYHPGCVLAAEQGPDVLRLEIGLRILADAWSAPGLAWYRIDLRRTRSGWEGTFAGEFSGRPVSGPMRVRAWTPARVGPALRPGEHPRLLLRAGDLAAVRARLDTPLGRALLPRLEQTMAGCALRWRLDGDRAWADRARALAAEALADVGNGNKQVANRVWGVRLEQLALAYDLCHDAWDDGFRATVAAALVRGCRRVLAEPGKLNSGDRYVAGRHHGTTIAGAALAGIVLWGEPGPAVPPRPTRWSLDQPSQRLPAAGPSDVAPALLPADGLAIDWLWADGGDADPATLLAALGASLPTVDSDVVVGDLRARFAAVPAGEAKDRRLWRGVFDQRSALVASGALSARSVVVATAVRVDQPTWVAVESGGVDLVVSGVVLAEGEVVELQPGVHPIRAATRLPEITNWGKHPLDLRLVPVDGSERERRQRLAERERDIAVGIWEADRAESAALGGACPEYLRWFAIGRLAVRQVFAEGIGAGGFQNSAEFPMGLEGAHKYPLAYQTAFGVDPLPDDAAAAWLPNQLFRRLWTADGKELAQDLCGENHVRINDVYHETRDLLAEMMLPLLPLASPETRPALLWWWQRRAGGADPERLLAVPVRPYDGAIGNPFPVWALVRFPLDLVAEPPAGRLPLAWHAPATGYVGLRNAFAGPDDILVEISARSSQAERGMPIAGAVRIAGFGEAWSHGFDRAPRFRYAENAVQLVDAPMHDQGRGRLLAHVQQADGSGSVMMDLSDCTTPLREGVRRAYETYGGPRRADAFAEPAVPSVRAVAVDYSGRCGAPALVVIADRIDSAHAKRWQWVLDASHDSVESGQRDKNRDDELTWRGKTYPRSQLVLEDFVRPLADQPGVALDDGLVRISRGGAVLQMRLASDAPAPLRLLQREFFQQNAKATVSRNAMQYVAAEGAGRRFLVVMTLGRGEPPAIVLEGTGAALGARVGGRRVRLDGDRIVIEDAP